MRLAVLAALTLTGRAFGQQTVEDFVKCGNARRARGDLKGAVADYTKAVELNPKLAVAYYNSANARGSKATGKTTSPTSQKPLNSTQNTPPHKPNVAKSKNTKAIRMLKWPTELKPLNSTKDRPLLEAGPAKSKEPKTIRTLASPASRTP